MPRDEESAAAPTSDTPSADAHYPPAAAAKAAVETPPSALLVHSALITGQVLFGGGSVVGKLGVASFNPMMFALIREGVAGVLLLAWAIYKDGFRRPKLADTGVFLACGFFIFTNQACFIVGDKLAGAVIGSAWQPTQPVFTLLISMLVGWERFTLGKGAGILISLGGAVFMVVYGADFGSKDATSLLAGNALFFFNCMGTSMYVICAKVVLLRGYPASSVTAWSYLVGALLLFPVASGFSSSCDLVAFICPPEPLTEPLSCGALPTSCDPWAVPSSAILPLAYWILGNSCVAYWLMTWANRHAQAGFVLAYCALQPLTSTLLSVVIISFVGNVGGLQLPGLNLLGGIAIVIGLITILREGVKDAENRAATAFTTLQEEWETTSRPQGGRSKQRGAGASKGGRAPVQTCEMGSTSG